MVNFAAESHVDRSIEDPQLFLSVNILGTQNLLDAARKAWVTGKGADGYPVWKAGKRYHQVSTDEVYGSLGEDGFFTETTPLCPHSPYSASSFKRFTICTIYSFGGYFYGQCGQYGLDGRYGDGIFGDFLKIIGDLFGAYCGFLYFCKWIGSKVLFPGPNPQRQLRLSFFLSIEQKSFFPFYKYYSFLVTTIQVVDNSRVYYFSCYEIGNFKNNVICLFFSTLNPVLYIVFPLLCIVCLFYVHH